MEIYLIMKNNILRSLYHKWIAVLFLILPVLLCIITAVTSQMYKPSVRIGVMTSDNRISEEQKEIIRSALHTPKAIQLKIADRESVQTDLLMEKYQILFDFTNGNMGYTMIQLRSNSIKGAIVTQQTRSIGVLVTFLMVTSVILFSKIIKDKVTGTYNRFCLASCKSSHYVYGYAAYVFVVTLIQAMLGTVSIMLMQNKATINLPESMLLAICMTVLATVFSMLICFGSNSDRNANISASGIAAILSLLSGTFVAIDSMPSFLKLASIINPVTWIISLSQFLS